MHEKEEEVGKSTKDQQTVYKIQSLINEKKE